MIEIKTDNETNNQIENKFRLVKIPKQNFTKNKAPVRPFLDTSIVNELKEVFDLFSKTDLVNPHNIKNALRTVSKKIIFISLNLLDFHKENVQIYKLIEELCLEYDMTETPIKFEYFIKFLNDRLGDNTSRFGINNVFTKLMDSNLKEITPESLHKLVSELGDKLSLDDVKYVLTKLSEPLVDINITSDEFYYIMTKKPAEVDLITPVTKSTK